MIYQLSLLLISAPTGMELLILLFAIVLIFLPILCLLDIVRTDRNSGFKISWILTVLFLPLVGSILYLSFANHLDTSSK